MEPRGIRLNNPGNIRKSSAVWQGAAEDQPDAAFVKFTAPEWGIRAIARVLIVYQDKRKAGDGSKVDTVKDFIERWAPPNENNTGAYVEHVTKIMAIGATATIDVYDYSTMLGLVKGIILHENGKNPYPDWVLEKGIKLAGILPPDKALAKSRTVAGGGIAAVGETGRQLLPLVEEFAATADTWATLQEYIPWLRYLFVAATVCGIALMLYARWDDKRKGRR